MLQKRSDGFHDIESIFYPVPIHDALELIKKDGDEETTLTLTNYGLPVNGAISDNLCVKAWYLLKEGFPDLPFVKIHLLKNIPMGSGLGGGSADGAFMLQLLNDKFHLNLSTEQLTGYALQLGSDCPFFIVNQPCYATGRGENMEPISLNLSGHQLVLENPGIHIDTGNAFSQLDLNTAQNKPGHLKRVIQQPIADWKENLNNDFEIPVFRQYPQIKVIKEKFYAEGALYAAMSGSGSTVYGLFKKSVGVKPAIGRTIVNF